MGRRLLCVIVLLWASVAHGQQCYLDDDGSGAAGFGPLPWNSLTGFSSPCDPGFCVSGIIEGTTNEFDCQPCSGGGGGGTECSTSPCDLDAATTLGGQDICLVDGTNCPPFPTTPTPVLTTTPYPTPTVTASSTPTATATGNTATPTPTVTTTPTYTVPFITPTPQLTAYAAPTVCQTVCTGIGCIGGLRADNPPICNAIVATETPVSSATPTSVGTPLPVKDWTGASGTQPAYASFDHEHAIQRIDQVPVNGTPALLIKPTAAPGVGQTLLSVEGRTGGDPIFRVMNTTDDGFARGIMVRLDTGTTQAIPTTGDQKPFQVFYGTAANPKSLFVGSTGFTMNSTAKFEDDNLEYGSIQSYTNVDPSNTGSFFTSGIGSNIDYQGTGGDFTLVPGIPSAGFSSFQNLQQGGSANRFVVGTYAQLLSTAVSGGTSATGQYHGFRMVGGEGATCTTPGNCVALSEVVGLSLDNFDDKVTATNYFSLKSVGTRVHLEHAGAVYIQATPTPVPTNTSATATPTVTATASPTATTGGATATPVAATATPTPAPTSTPLEIVGGQPIIGCHTVHIGGQSAATNYCGGPAGCTTTQGNIAVGSRRTVYLKNLVCEFSNDVRWAKTFSAEFEVASLATCNATADNGTLNCAWLAQSDGTRCDIKGTQATNEKGCGEETAFRPGSNYRAGPTVVNERSVYHLVIRSGLTGTYSCSWDVCPQGGL